MTDDRSPFALPPVPRDFLVDRHGVSEISQPEASRVTSDWLDGRLKHFSATSLKLLKMCPEQFRQRYILGRKERPGEALTLGSAVHSALGHNFKQKIESHEDVPVLEVVEFFHDKAWPAAIENDGGADEIRWDDQDTARRDGERMTMAYHANVSPRVQPTEQPEQKITLHVEGVPVPVIGYLDVVEEANVVDWKTGKAVQRKPDANWRLQGTLYGLATQKPVHFHSVSRAKTPSIATPLTDDAMAIPYREDIAQVTRTYLADYAAQVEFFANRYGFDDPWPTTGLVMDLKGGACCNYCGFRKDCSAWAWERAIVTDMVGIDGKPLTLGGTP